MRPGDVLLYAARDIWGCLIQVKTWSDVSHSEVYLGAGQVAASRDGLGVDTYWLRADPPRYIMRPGAIDLRAALAWHETVRGQQYDWWGLLRFFWPYRWTGGAPPHSFDRQFCSEHTTRFLRRGGCEPFRPETDADLIAPGTFVKYASPAALVTVRAPRET